VVRGNLIQNHFAVAGRGHYVRSSDSRDTKNGSNRDKTASLEHSILKLYGGAANGTIRWLVAIDCASCPQLWGADENEKR